MPNDVEELLARSASTDIQVLLTAKESAKRAALDDPSQANLAALDRASKMLESAMEATKTLKNWQAVLDHVAENGRKLSKSKLYKDISEGRLRKQPDGTFRLRDVQRYMASLPTAGTPDALVRKAADRQRRKEEADIRKAEATRFARANGLDIVDGDYDHARWLQQVSGLEHEPERGARCQECFVCRLMATAAYASWHGFVTFATTLASSRWKSMEQVDRAGRVAQEAFPGTVYWSHNWRRGGLQERRNELLRQYAFYNQRYCGCEFSLQARLRHEEERG